MINLKLASLYFAGVGFVKPTWNLSKLSSIVLIFLVTIPTALQTQAADAFSNRPALSTVDAFTSLPACKGVPVATQKEALKSIKSDVCTNAQQLLAGTQTSKQIGTDIQAV